MGALVLIMRKLPTTLKIWYLLVLIDQSLELATTSNHSLHYEQLASHDNIIREFGFANKCSMNNGASFIGLHVAYIVGTLL